MEILSLSIVNAVIEAKIVHQSSTLLLTEQHSHQSEEARVLAREEKTMVSTRKRKLTVGDSVFMYGLLLVGDK